MSDNVAFELADRDREAEPSGNDALSAQEVVDYLDRHPDLLVDHPELIERLELPGPPAPAASLHHWQLRRWRGQANRHRQALDQLHRVAEENAVADRLLHRFCQALLEADDRSHEMLDRLIKKTFEVNASRVAALADLGQASRKQLAGWLDNPFPHCGRITDTVREELFGPALAQTGSAALIAVRAGGADHTTHVVALGRHTPDGFNPAQGTHFLEQIGELAAAFLPAPGA
ncbi:MAG: DUF484 family protein [Guyparkeria sp.]